MSDPTKLYLYKRTNGIYYIGYWYDGRRQWKSTRSTRRSDALKALTNLRDLLQSRRQAPHLSRFIQEYIAHADSQLSPGTVVGYRAALRSLLKFAGDRPLSAISQRDVDGYIAYRLQRVKPVTVNIDLTPV